MESDSVVGKIKVKKNHDHMKPYDRKKSVLGRVAAAIAPSWLVDLVGIVQQQSSETNSISENSTVGGVNNGENSSNPHQSSAISLSQRVSISTSVSQMQHASSTSQSVISTVLSSTDPNKKSDNAVNDASLNSFAFVPLTNDPSRVSFQQCKQVLPEENFGAKSSFDFQKFNYHNFDSASSGASKSNEVREISHAGILSFTSDLLPLTKKSISTSLQQRNLTELTDNSSEISDVSHITVAHSEPPAGNDTSNLDGSNMRSALWSSHRLSMSYQHSVKRVKPAFNVSLLGSVLSADTSTNNNRLESSFYLGQTTYGGASSAKNIRPPTSGLPYAVAPRQLRVKTLGNANNDTAMSNTARQILHALEAKSVSLGSDASSHSILSSRKPVNTPLSFNPISFPSSFMRRKVKQDQSKTTLGPPVRGYMTQLQNKQKFEVKPTQSAITSASIDSAGLRMPSVYQTSAAGGGGGKMKRDRGAFHYSHKNTLQTENQEEELCELPTAEGFVLPLSNPKPFSLLPTDNTTSSVTNVSHSSTFYHFPSPIVAHRPSRSEVTSPPSLTQFQFSSPLDATRFMFQAKTGTSPKLPQESSKLIQTISSLESSGIEPTKKLLSTSEYSVISTALSASFNSSPSSVSSDKYMPLNELFKKDVGAWNCPNCFVNNKAHQSMCPCCSTQKPFSSSSTSKPADKNSISSSNVPLKELFKTDAGSWSCPSCYVTNKVDQLTCPCCATAKPQSSDVSIITSKSLSGTTSDNSSLMSLFKKDVGSWSCPTCMVMNKPDQALCPCCNTKKPAMSNSIKTATSSDSTSLMNLFKQDADSWNCPTCMVTNKPSQLVCPCCNTKKPELSTTVTTLASSDSSSLMGLFKQEAGSWSCPTCMVANKPDQVVCPCCNTKKPELSSSVKTDCSKTTTTSSSLMDLFKQDAGSWNCPTCMVSNKASQLMCPCCATPMPQKPGKDTIATDKSSGLPANSSTLSTSSSSVTISSNKTTVLSHSATLKEPVTVTSSISSAPLLSDVFKKKANTWDCPTCFVTNKVEQKMCPCCNTSQPASQSTSLAAASSYTSSSKSKMTSIDIFKENDKSVQKADLNSSDSKASLVLKATEPWECTTCSALNKSTSCTVCGAPRAGFRLASSVQMLPSGGFTFGSTVNNTSTTTANFTSGFASLAGSSGFGAFVATSKSLIAATSTSNAILSGGFQFPGIVSSSFGSIKSPSTSSFQSSLIQSSTENSLSPPNANLPFNKLTTIGSSDDASRSSAQIVSSVSSFSSGIVNPSKASEHIQFGLSNLTKPNLNLEKPNTVNTTPYAGILNITTGNKPVDAPVSATFKFGNNTTNVDNSTVGFKSIVSSADVKGSSTVSASSIELKPTVTTSSAVLPSTSIISGFRIGQEALPLFAPKQISSSLAVVNVSLADENKLNSAVTQPLTIFGQKAGSFSEPVTFNTIPVNSSVSVNNNIFGTINIANGATSNQSQPVSLFSASATSSQKPNLVFPVIPTTVTTNSSFVSNVSLSKQVPLSSSAAIGISNTSQPGFSFGNSSADVPKPFSFGGSSLSTTVSSQLPVSASSQALFAPNSFGSNQLVFGSAVLTATTAPLFGSASSVSSVPVFGSSTSLSNSSSAFAFGKQQTSSQPPTFGLQVPSQQVKSFGFPATQVTTSTFSFGTSTFGGSVSVAANPSANLFAPTSAAASSAVNLFASAGPNTSNMFSAQPVSSGNMFSAQPTSSGNIFSAQPISAATFAFGAQPSSLSSFAFGAPTNKTAASGTLSSKRIASNDEVVESKRRNQEGIENGPSAFGSTPSFNPFSSQGSSGASMSTTPNFNFGAQGAATFQFGSSAVNTPGGGKERVVKKAVRKLIRP